MEKKRLLQILEDYSKIATEHTPSKTIISFLKRYDIIKDEEKSQLNLTHWNSTAYSYFKIPETTKVNNINSDIADDYEIFASKEQLILEKLRESHLNILLKIINHEMELDSRKA